MIERYTLDYTQRGWCFRLKNGQYAKHAVQNSSTLAHDIVDHKCIEEIGTFEDEIKALGAWWYQRAQHNDDSLRSIKNEQVFRDEVYDMAVESVNRPLVAIETPVKSIMHDEFAEIIAGQYDPELNAVVLGLLDAGVNNSVERFDKHGLLTAYDVFENIRREAETPLIYDHGTIHLKVDLSTNKVNVFYKEGFYEQPNPRRAY